MSLDYDTTRCLPPNARGRLLIFVLLICSILQPAITADTVSNSNTTDINAEWPFFTEWVWVDADSTGKYFRISASESCDDIEVQTGYSYTG